MAPPRVLLEAHALEMPAVEAVGRARELAERNGAEVHIESATAGG